MTIKMMMAFLPGGELRDFTLPKRWGGGLTIRAGFRDDYCTTP